MNLNNYVDQLHTLIEQPHTFRTWLEDNPRKLAGYPADCYKCPIASFLKDKLPTVASVESLAVMNCYVILTLGTSDFPLYIPLLDWASYFIEELDEQAHKTKNSAIRRSTAFKVLQKTTSS